MSGSRATIRRESRKPLELKIKQGIRRSRPMMPPTRREQKLEALIRAFEDEAQA